MNKLSASKLFLAMTCLLSINACQQLPFCFQPEAEQPAQQQQPKIQAKQTPYSDYYHWLQSLSIEQLKEEIAYQEQLREAEHIEANVRLILLYSLPNSPVKNPHRARKDLNQQFNENSQLKDIGWLAVFYDQLVEQVQLLNKLDNVLRQQKANELLKEMELAELIAEVEEQEQQITHLQYQLKQLRKIEKAISQRDQDQNNAP